MSTHLTTKQQFSIITIRSITIIIGAIQSGTTQPSIPPGYGKWRGVFTFVGWQIAL